MSATLSTHNDQTLFQPVTFEPGIAQREGGHIYDGVAGTIRADAGDNRMAVAYSNGVICLNDQGGQSMSVTEDVCNTLRAEMHQHLPIVCAASEKRGISVENHANDSRVQITDPDTVQSLTSRMGTGGGNVPLVLEPIVYDGAAVTSPINKSNPKPGDPCHTLSTDSRNFVVEPTYCLQGGGATSQGSQGSGINDGVSFTLNATDRHGVAYGTDVGFFNSIKEQSPTLLSRMYKDPPLISFEGCEHIVRRLTPTECARLQGFPDLWGHPQTAESFTDDEYNFWLDVRNTHAAINGKTVKAYTKEQILKWYNKLHTDSSEYKMWGNGIALPTALYVMEGIADALRNIDYKEEPENDPCTVAGQAW